MSNRDDEIAARREAEWSDLGAGLGRVPARDDFSSGDWSNDGMGSGGSGGSGMRPVNTSAPREQWKGRRRMAWVALCAVLIVTSLAIFYIP